MCVTIPDGSCANSMRDSKSAAGPSSQNNFVVRGISRQRKKRRPTNRTSVKPMMDSAKTADLWTRHNCDLTYVQSEIYPGASLEIGFPDNDANTEPSDWYSDAGSRSIKQLAIQSHWRFEVRSLARLPCSQCQQQRQFPRILRQSEPTPIFSCHAGE